jgi:hypothetical protein
MRRVIYVLMLTGALLLGGFTQTAASADNGDGDDFRLVAISNQFENVDVGAEGESVGDYFVFSDDLYKHGHLVGTLEGQCTVTRIDEEAGAFHQQCLVTAVLPKGQLTVQGAIVFDADSPEDRVTLAITGGTGRFADAAGQVHVRFVSDTKTRIHVDLR